MNRLYWVRHGESVVNITKEMSHRLVDKPLTAKGVIQAQQTADYFEDKDIDAIYCSPLKRAQETADIIAERLELPVIPLENFREINIGDLERRPPDANGWALHMQIVLSWMAGYRTARFPGGEDGFELSERILTGLRTILPQNGNAAILVVGHGGSFVSVLQDFCPAIELEWLKSAHMENCSITEIIFDHEELAGKLVSWARHDHLSGEAAELIPGIPGANEFGGR